MMRDVYITKIHINQVRHLKNVEIELSSAQRKHLILTGKNGSGKTSLLEAMRDAISNEQQATRSDGIQFDLLSDSKRPDVVIIYSTKTTDLTDNVFIYVPSGRNKFILPKSIEPLEIQGKEKIAQNVSKDFLKYILSLDYQLYGAMSDNNKLVEQNIREWFNNFISALRNIYDCQELKLHRDTKNLAFIVEMPGREPFALSEMSDGYAAFLEIFMELIMRFEGEGVIVEYDNNAVVIIDEIETHLHVELQKRVLPFLTNMFPNVQFIVSTHSPFVITSLKDAVVYDLEHREQLENPSIYSYEAVVEGYLNVGQYSEEVNLRHLHKTAQE